MALQSFVGSITAKTTTGNQAYTGVGFQPKALIFFATTQTADGSATTYVASIGMAVSSSSRVGMGVFDDYGSTTAPCRHDNTKCITFLNGSGTVLLAADLVSLDADGFTLNWTTASGSAVVINYIALGGADLTNTSIVQFTGATSTGNQAITGAGFQPDCVMLISAHLATAPPANTSASRNFCVGVGTSATARGAMTFGFTSGASSDARYQRTNKIMVAISSAGTPSVTREADLVSLDSDGLTVNWSTVSAAADYIWALCLKGGSFLAGNETQKTSTGTKATTGMSFTPVGILAFSKNGAAATTITSGTGFFSIGAASGTAARGCIWVGDGSSNAQENLDRTKVLKCITDGTPTINSAADLSSFDSGGVTFNWTTADATAREFVYLALGSAAAATVLPRPRLISQAVNRAAAY